MTGVIVTQNLYQLLGSGLGSGGFHPACDYAQRRLNVSVFLVFLFRFLLFFLDLCSTFPPPTHWSPLTSSHDYNNDLGGKYKISGEQGKYNWLRKVTFKCRPAGFRGGIAACYYLSPRIDTSDRTVVNAQSIPLRVGHQGSLRASNLSVCLCFPPCTTIHVFLCVSVC